MTIQHKALHHAKPHRFFCLNKQDTPSGFYTDLFYVHFVTQVLRDIPWYNNHIQDVIKSMGAPKGVLEFSIFGDHNRFITIRRDNVNRFFLVLQDYDLKDVVLRLGSKSELFTQEVLQNVLDAFEIDPVEFKQIAKNFLESRDFNIKPEELARLPWYRRLRDKKVWMELTGAEGNGFFNVWITQEHFPFKPTVTEVEIRRNHSLESARSDYKGNGVRITSTRFVGDVDIAELTGWINRTQCAFLTDWDVFSVYYSAFANAGKFSQSLADWDISGVFREDFTVADPYKEWDISKAINAGNISGLHPENVQR